MDVFCKIIRKEIPSRTIYEDDKIIVILDVNPQSAGHTLIIPKDHYIDLFDIDSDTLEHIIRKSKDIGNLLYDKLGCDGITLVQNNGSVEEVKHFHLHLIPQYNSDNNLSIEDVFKKLV